MVKNIFIGLLSCLLFSSAFSMDRCTKETKDDPPLCPLKLPQIVNIKITQNAAKSPAETDPAISCKEFRISEKQIRRILRLTKTIDVKYEHTAVLWSPCYAGGEMTFGDGRSAFWSMNQYQYGSLIFSDSDEKLILYCPECKFSPFKGW